MKKLAVIGCGIASIPILKKAKEIYVQTYCFSLSINPAAEGLYDYHYNIDYYDVKSIIETCRGLCVDGVIATGENTTAATAIIAKELGLVGNRYQGLFICRNKYEERKALEDAKYVKQPKYSLYANGMIPSFPVIVKAIDSSGKKGISIARTTAEFYQAVNYAKEASQDDKILVEQYIDGGSEYSIECISAKGKHQIIQITQKDVSGPPHFAELGHHQPGEIEVPYDKLENAIFEILDKTGVENSLSHVEIKIKDQDIYFIEIGARGGGDRISDTLIYLSTDFDYYKSAILAALGEYDFSLPIRTHFSGIYFLCKQTKRLSPLFEYAKGKSWCKELVIPDGTLSEMKGNNDPRGYLIYQLDHKLTLRDIPFVFSRINDFPDAYSMLCEFTRISGRQISDDDMAKGMRKFLDAGNVIGCYFDGHLYGMANVYCNHTDSGDAYLCNLEVLSDYRGLGLSKKLMNAAYKLIVDKDFSSVSLDVDRSNKIARNLYENEGFLYTGQSKIVNGETLLEMRKYLVLN